MADSLHDVLRAFTISRSDSSPTRQHKSFTLRYALRPKKQLLKRQRMCFLWKTKLSWRYTYTGRFIMFSVITNTYNKKTKGPNLMEFFTATGKLKKSFFW